MSGRADVNGKNADRAKLIKHLLDEVESDLDQKGKQNDFIESLRKQFDEKGFLSDKQLEALNKFYANV
jgi:hypothetical protein